ncbi:MAG: serine O-acetyltransferase [Candidatus Izemoplasmatales bacterium]
MNLKPIIDSIFKSYRLLPIEKDHCSCRLPSNSEIKDIVMLSKELLFPGYFSKRTVDVHGDYRYTAKIIKKLHKKLKDQISTALLYLADSSKDKDIKKKSCSLCVEYIKLIPSIRETLHTDLEAHYLSDPAAFNKDQIVVSYPGFYAITVHRLAHALHLLGVPVLPRMMSEFAHRETGIDINPAAEIGEYFFIDHGTGVVIGETTTIGRNVKIYQGVTLGALSLRGGQNLKGTKRHPTIEDNVTIYSGASILGGNTVIGENSTIGSNVYITGSLPANSRVSIKVPELVIKTYTKKEDEKHVV